MAYLVGARPAMPASVQAQIAAGLRVQTSIFGKPLTIVYGTNRITNNLIWYGDFNAIAQNQGSSGGKGGLGGSGGKGGGSASGSYDYQTSLIMALCEGPISGIANIWQNKTVTSLSALGLTLYTGTYSQTAWPYLSSNHPTQAMNYRGVAYVCKSAYDLGTSPETPQHSFEVQGLLYGVNVPAGADDASAADVIYDFLTNANYGVPGWQTGWTDSFKSGAASLYNYTLANGLLFSPIVDSQESAQSVLTRWMQILNVAPVWSQGVLRIVPYGDAAATGNSVTYTPDLTPIYSITDDDYIVGKGGQPVLCDRRDPADVYNQLVLEVVDRGNNYNVTPVEVKDEGYINQFGYNPQPSVIQAHEYADLTTARTAAQLILQRQIYQGRNVYTFTLPVNFCLLEPMDLIEISDPNLGIDRLIVRVITVDEAEGDKGDIKITAEDPDIGSGASAAYPPFAPSPYVPNYNVNPGDTAAPFIFDAPRTISATPYEIWMAVAGGADWGGCQVWISSDGNSYSLLGTIANRARYGVLTAPFPMGSDPDTTDICYVDLSASQGQLLSGTKDDADNFNTLCYCDGELFSYEVATLTSAYHYELGTYLRRGAYYTPPFRDHPTGAAFARLDDAIFRYAYGDPSRIGQTVFLKFPAFNVYGGGLQSLASVAAYTYTIGGPIGAITMPTPTGLELYGQASGNSFVGKDAKFAWRQVSSQLAYDIGSEPIGNTQAGSGPAGSGAVDPEFKDFVVEMFDVDADGNITGDPLRTEYITTPVYIYTWEKNAEDQLARTGIGNTPARIFGIEVFQRGINGEIGTPAAMVVSNPVPPLPTAVSFPVTPTSIFMSYTPPPVTDFAGVLIWMSTTSGFTPSGSTQGSGNCVYAGADLLPVINATPGQTYYLRYAAFDTFGTTGLNISGEIAVSVPYIIGADLADNTIVTSKIAANAITTAEIAAGAVTTTQIANSAVTAAQLAAAAVGTSAIASDAITTALIASGAVTNVQIATGTIVAGNIAAGIITSALIASGTIVAGNIAASTITGSLIAAATIAGSNIAGNTITGSNIAANTITATNLSVSQLSAITADLGTITAGSISINGGLFSVDSSGNVTITNATTGDQLQVKNNVIKVITGGVTVVQIGNLAA